MQELEGGSGHMHDGVPSMEGGMTRHLWLLTCVLSLGACGDSSPDLGPLADAGDIDINVEDMGAADAPDVATDLPAADAGPDDVSSDSGPLQPNNLPIPFEPRWAESCPAGTVDDNEGPCATEAPRPPVWDCEAAEGWATTLIHGIEVCDAPTPPETCPSGSYPSVTSNECLPIGTECPGSAWLSEAAVRELAPGFDGAEFISVGSGPGADYPDVESALEATDGEVLIALAAEPFEGGIALDGRRVALVGACVSQSIIGGSDSEFLIVGDGELALANLSLAEDSQAVRTEGSSLSLRHVHARRSASTGVDAEASDITVDTVWFEGRGGEGYWEARVLELDESGLVGTDLSITDIASEGIRAARSATVVVDRILLQGRAGIDGNMGIHVDLGADARLSTAIADRFSQGAFSVSYGFLGVDRAAVRRLSGGDSVDTRPAIAVAIYTGELELRHIVASDCDSRGIVLQGSSATITDSVFLEIHNRPDSEAYATFAANENGSVAAERVVISGSSHNSVSLWNAQASLTDVAISASGSAGDGVYGAGLYVTEGSEVSIERVSVLEALRFGLRATDSAVVSGTDLHIEGSPSDILALAGTASLSLDAGSAELERVTITDASSVAIFALNGAEADLTDVFVARAGDAAATTRPYTAVAVTASLRMRRVRARDIIQGFAASAVGGTLELQDFEVEPVAIGNGSQHHGVLTEATAILERGRISIGGVGAVARGAGATISITDVSFDELWQTNPYSAHGVELLDGASGVLTNVRIENARGVGIYNYGGTLDGVGISISQVAENVEGHAHGVLTYDGRTSLRDVDVRGAPGIGVGFARSASGSINGVAVQDAGVCLAGPDAAAWVSEEAATVNQCLEVAREVLGISRPSIAREI